MAGNANKRRPARMPADDQSALLRELPSIDECLRAADHVPAMAALARRYVKLMVQRQMGELRATIGIGGRSRPQSRAAIIEEILLRAERAIAADQPALMPVVNATGVVLHTNLGRALLPRLRSLRSNRRRARRSTWNTIWRAAAAAIATTRSKRRFAR